MEDRKEKVLPEGMKRVCIAGVGAIGGILGSMLCRAYPGQVTLIARGARAESFRTNGVVMHSEYYGEVKGMPGTVTADARDLPVQDCILFCVKNYSLEQIAEELRPQIGEETILVSVQNGVDAGDRLRAMFPQATVCDSVTYTTTGVNEDYSVSQNGPYTYVFIGSKTNDARERAAAEKVRALFVSAGFDMRFTDEVVKELWSKYILNCAFNTVTARHLAFNGDIRRSPALQADTEALLRETYAVSEAEGVGLPPDLPDQKFRFMMTRQSEKATSSMMRDAKAHRPLEIEAFSGTVIRLAKKHGIPVPVTERYYRELKENMG
ncbi:MAG: 2-dehydropantoate 2-reductase [Lachnospiraceae bacterium]|nr:2-dehydropantoate 2-reductase [Lachnospiraceae bacterium]